MKRAPKKRGKKVARKVALPNFIPPWADLPPSIIHTLRVLLDSTAFPPGQDEWVKNGVRATLERWDKHEDLEQLKRDLGLTGKKRRKGLTMRRETAICAAIESAALAGTANQKQAAGDELDADEREVQRAWRKWYPAIFERLYLMERAATSTTERQTILRAMELLKYPGDTN